ncbi:cytochrome bc complex cytochrome b subunit [Ignatzschineria sp. RMDPL8A]|uniref:cytochrome b n=1 Tax=Ignatzschineria sp. RMDPL8A TaxID=2999236 RepID=UPI001692DB7D|nr:cytochrome bc complex cytochrome b subunit [Ignatzschineria sp. RMDPL8A]MDG9730071.1 cytochrome bc complex cytochrome b subunit [Ignatzschineria sp. RMDPL8A]NLD09405.1 cytochrome bc complex cytochrome b subunit [Xanthomonadaceae bacterium]
MSTSNKSAAMRLWDWVNDRLPVNRALKTHMTEYYAPKNFNFLYIFGVLAMVVLVNQILTGIWLVMHFKPDGALSATGIPIAYASLETAVMRDTAWMWLIRYMHAVGASMFFIVVYMHMFRGLIYGSHRKPRELVWIFGMLIYLVLMAEAFMGYVLPYGQMSFWGAQVIISLFGAIPYIGDTLVTGIRGDFVISEATLSRFFALHVIALPLVLVGLVVAHILALHEVGSNNPDGIEIKEHKDENGIPLDGIPFHPYYTVHDTFAVGIFMIVFALIIFYAPDMFGLFLESPNFEPANPLATPDHIAPVWYFTPYYSILRAVPSWFGTQIWGVIAMGASIAVLFFLPWLDKSPVKSIRYKGTLTKVLVALFVVAFIILGYLGVVPATDARTFVARICSIYYFAFFFGMPWWSKMDTVKPVPERVTMK